jgi:hypothetical protein
MDMAGAENSVHQDWHDDFVVKFQQIRSVAARSCSIFIFFIVFHDIVQVTLQMTLTISNATVNSSKISAASSTFGFGYICICLLIGVYFMLICSRRCWDHGRNLPAWNTALLPEHQRLDTENDGNVTMPTPQTASARKRARTTATLDPSAASDDALTSLIQVSKHLMEQSFSAPSSLGAMSSGAETRAETRAETQRTESMRELLESAKVLQSSLLIFPESLHESIRKEIEETGERFLEASR